MHQGIEAVSTEMGTVKWCVSEGHLIALIQSMQENVKISKHEGTGCTSQESWRQAPGSLVPPENLCSGIGCHSRAKEFFYMEISSLMICESAFWHPLQPHVLFPA